MSAFCFRRSSTFPHRQARARTLTLRYTDHGTVTPFFSSTVKKPALSPLGYQVLLQKHIRSKKERQNVIRIRRKFRESHQKMVLINCKFIFLTLYSIQRTHPITTKQAVSPSTVAHQNFNHEIEPLLPFLTDLTTILIFFALWWKIL